MTTGCHETEDRDGNKRGLLCSVWLRAFQMLGGGREGGWSWKGCGGSVSVLGLHPLPPIPVPSSWLRNVSALPGDHPWGLLGPPGSRHCARGILTPPHSPRRPTRATGFPHILLPPSLQRRTQCR